MRLHVNMLHIFFSTKTKFCGQLFIFVSYHGLFSHVVQSHHDLTNAMLCFDLCPSVNSLLFPKRKPSKAACGIEQARSLAEIRFQSGHLAQCTSR